MKEFFALFTDFENFGNLLWLLWPVVLMTVLAFKRKSPGERALVFVLGLSYLFLAVRGNAYARYLFTLYPFFLALVFLGVWDILGPKRKGLRWGGIFTCSVLALLNIYQYRKSFGFYWNYRVLGSENNFPQKVLEFINRTDEIRPEDTVLVCSHRHLFFYYTDKKGLDARDPRLEAFFRQTTKDAALRMLKSRYGVRFILQHWTYNATPILKDIIAEDCELLVQAEGEGLFFYRLIDKDWTPTELAFLFPERSLIANGSFETWSRGPLSLPDFFDKSDNLRDGMIVREDRDVRVGHYAARITGDDFNLGQELIPIEQYRGKAVTGFVWARTRVPGKFRVEIYDGVRASFSPRHSGRDRWELLQVNHTISPEAKFVIVRLVQAARTGGRDDVIIVDGGLLVEGDWNTFYLYRRQKVQ